MVFGLRTGLRRRIIQTLSPRQRPVLVTILRIPSWLHNSSSSQKITTQDLLSNEPNGFESQPSLVARLASLPACSRFVMGWCGPWRNGRILRGCVDLREWPARQLGQRDCPDSRWIFVGGYLQWFGAV